MRNADLFLEDRFGLITGKRRTECEAVLCSVDGQASAFACSGNNGVARTSGNQLHLRRYG